MLENLNTAMASNGAFVVSISATDNASKVLENLNKKLAALHAPAERFNKAFSKFSDLSGLTKIASGFRGIERAALGAFRSVGQIVAPLGAITGAASLGGLYKLAEAWGAFGTKLAIAATNIGIMPAQLKLLQNAARAAGVSAEAMANSLANANKTRQDAMYNRDPAAMRQYQAAGINIRDSKYSNPEKLLEAEADHLKRMKDAGLNQAAINLVASTWHIDPTLVPTLMKGSAAWIALQQAVKKYTTTSPGVIEAEQTLYRSSMFLTESVETLGETIAAKLSPTLSPLMVQLADWINSHRDLIATKVVEYIQKFVEWCETAWQKVDDIVQAFGGWKRVLVDIVELMAARWAVSVALPFIQLATIIGGAGGVTAAIEGLGAAFAVLTAPEWMLALLAGAGLYAGYKALGGADAKSDPRNSRTAEGRAARYAARNNPAPEVMPNFNTRDPAQRAAKNAWLAQHGKSAATTTPPLSGDAIQRSTQLLKQYEGFSSKAAWDVNAYRAGYGSDTTTDPITGAVSHITKGSVVSRAAADADLARRISTQFMPNAANAVGAAAWAKLSPDAQAALTSVAYNYGHLPPSVVAAARAGDVKAIGAAITGLSGENGGINAKRRASEAQIAMGSPLSVAPAVGPVKHSAALDIRLIDFPSNITTQASTTGMFEPPRVSHAMGAL